VQPLVEKELSKYKLVLLKTSVTNGSIDVVVVNLLKHTDIIKHKVWLKFFNITVVGVKLLQIWGFSRKRVLRYIRFCRGFTQK